MANEPVTLDQVKTHLRLETTATEEDDYIKILMAAALRSIENSTGRDLAVTWPTLDQRDQVVVGQAVFLLVGHWYANREAVGKDGGEMPLAVQWLIAPLRIWHV